MKISSVTIGQKIEICFEAGASLTLIIMGICVILSYVYPETVYPVCGLTFLFLGLIWGFWKYLPTKEKLLKGFISVGASSAIVFLVQLWVLSETNPAEYNRMMHLIYFSMGLGVGIVVIVIILDEMGVFDSFKKDVWRILK